MKYRTDFITNSSSSSFVIAIKNEATKEEIYKILLKKYKKYFTQYYKEAKNAAEEYDEEFKYTCVEDIIKAFSNRVIEVIDSSVSPLKLDSWNCTAIEASSEDGFYDLLSSAIYYLGTQIDTEVIKIK